MGIEPNTQWKSNKVNIELIGMGIEGVERDVQVMSGSVRKALLDFSPLRQLFN